MAGRVVALGEAMIRLSPAAPVRLEQATDLRVHVGGTELNVLIVLAQFGYETTWVTRLPKNALGRSIAGHAQRHVVTLEARWDPDARAGLYFVEPGSPPRPTEVVYDRAGSAASRMAPGDVDWAALLDGARCLHVSGITLALGDGPRRLAIEALETARSLGVTTSFDVNHRARLWPAELARDAYRAALPLADVVFATAFDLAMLLETETPPPDAARTLRERHGIRIVVVPERTEIGPTRVGVSVAAIGDESAESRCHEAEVVDPIGAGDAIAGAFLALHLRGEPLARAVEVAARAGAFKHTLAGDALVADEAQLDPDYGGGRRILR